MIARHAAIQTIPAGGIVVASDMLLSGQAGSQPDLVLHWNEMRRITQSLDLVLHLHGYSPQGIRMNIAVEKLPISGLDFGDPDTPPGATPSRSRPTLCILPRGRFFGGQSGFGYDFPVLAKPQGCARLLHDAHERFDGETGLKTHIARRILTAHSGGVAALTRVADEFEPHEIHVFDGLYAANPDLQDWVRDAIATDAHAVRHQRSLSAYMEHAGHALRAAYIARTGTETASLELKDSIQTALAAQGDAGAALAPWYRVEAVEIEHFQIPRTLGWLWLTDAGAALPPIFTQSKVRADRQ